MIQDKYPILSERRIIAEIEPLDFFNRLTNDPEDANTHMIGYYAALQSVDMRRHYRQFYVVHTEPEAACAQRWKSTIHNISDIISPEQCVDELSKESKESLFDFLDWAMRPKAVQEDQEVEKETEALDVQELGDAPMEVETVEHTAY